MKKKIIIGIIVISAFSMFSIIIIQNQKLQKQMDEIATMMQNQKTENENIENINKAGNIDGTHAESLDIEDNTLSGNEKALKMAKELLEKEKIFFLKDDLIKTLNQKGFSDEEINYAMDNCKPYWKEKALNIAIIESNTPCSYKRIIDVLEAFGFTNDEATYGADNCGADWNEQADKFVKEYNSGRNYTRETLIESLKVSGFTEEQAEYAADVNGY